MTETLIGAGALQARLTAIKGPGIAALLRAHGAAVIRESKLLAPRRTGNLSRSIHIAEVTESRMLVVASANYAAAVEFGTGPHEITPRAKKALRFAASAGGARLTGSPRTGAAVVFAKRVHHPGTRAHPFLLKGAEKALADGHLKDTIVAAWNSKG